MAPHCAVDNAAHAPPPPTPSPPSPPTSSWTRWPALGLDGRRAADGAQFLREPRLPGAPGARHAAGRRAAGGGAQVLPPRSAGAAAQIEEEHAFALELAAAEVPVVAPLLIGGRTLHEHGGFLFSVTPRRGGRAPELGDGDTLEWIGRFLARLHTVGARRPFAHRPAVDVASYGIEPRRLAAGARRAAAGGRARLGRGQPGSY
jgi:hypothetical protein